MDASILTSNRLRLESNRAYSAKLSWKRKETFELRRQIKEFLEVNFNVKLPKLFKVFKKEAIRNKALSAINDEFSELVKCYYSLGDFGQSVGSEFRSGNESEVFTHAHLFSKHRLCPVWNWKKSKLIRSVYYNFLKETRLYNLFTPIHITLTLPHKDGLYKGKRFYADELITHFNFIRKKKKWQKFVYAGEYGVETSSNKTNGLHIHIHCLAFVYSPHLKQFREFLQKTWLKATGATEVWIESLYIHKKDSKGHFITEMKDSRKLLTFEQPDNTYTSVPEGKVIVRKKFYIQDEKKAIALSEQTDEEKESALLELHTKAILETIKYHFKKDCLKLDDNNYDLFLINEVLENTKGKRMYSRFGKFYNEPILNFNRFETASDKPEIILAEGSEDFGYESSKDNSDDNSGIQFNSANTHTAINPFTLEEVQICDTNIVVFYPEHLTYTGKFSSKPQTPLPMTENIYNYMGQKTVKEVLASIIISRFKNKL